MTTTTATATPGAVPKAGPKTASDSKKDTKMLGIVAMTLLVIGAMVGGGAFNLPQNMAQRAGLGAVLIAWLVSGLGVFLLARAAGGGAPARPEEAAMDLPPPGAPERQRHRLADVAEPVVSLVAGSRLKSSVAEASMSTSPCSRMNPSFCRITR